MNPRWVLIHRLRGPAYLLTFAATALLHQWHVLGFGQSWPLYLIVYGVLALAERAALANQPVAPYGVPYDAPYTGPSSNQPYGTGQPYGASPAYGQPHSGPTDAPYQHVGGSFAPVAPVDPKGAQPRDPDAENKSGGRF